MDKIFYFGSTATSGNNFTDREEDTKRLLCNFRNGINTILISPRHWGKTSLVKHVQEQMIDKTKIVVFMDIFPVEMKEISIDNILMQSYVKHLQLLKNGCL